MGGQRSLVIKLGGELLEPARAAEARAIARDLAVLVRGGHGVVVVHGGGPQVSALQKRLGMEPRMVGGRRVTDAETLTCMHMAVAGQVNVALCALLTAQGARPVGLHGASSLAIEAVRRPPTLVSGGGAEPVDFGYVGDVTGVNLELLVLLQSAGHVPVMACVGADAAGNTYNINADTVANAVAVRTRAEALVLCTGVPGVMRDVKDPSSRIPTLTRTTAEEAIRNGVIAAGMIPKVEESFRALEAGVSSVLIVGGLAEGDLVKAALEPGSVGTRVVLG